MKDTMLFSKDVIENLNNSASEIRPGMLLFYEYNPKYYDDSMDEKGKLWMGITNIYTLFFDCGRFLFKGEKKNGNLLRLFQRYKIINVKNIQTLTNYIYAIREIRAFFCHNKIENYNDMPTKWNQINIEVFETILEPDALRNNTSKPNYVEVNKALAKRTSEIYKIIFDTIENAKKYIKDNPADATEIIENWINIQADWLLETDDIRQSCIRSWFMITYMEVFRKMNPPYNLINDFVERCEGIIHTEGGEKEIATAISLGKKTIIDIYQYIYNNHKKEIKECMKELVRIPK